MKIKIFKKSSFNVKILKLMRNFKLLSSNMLKMYTQYDFVLYRILKFSQVFDDLNSSEYMI